MDYEIPMYHGNPLTVYPQPTDMFKTAQFGSLLSHMNSNHRLNPSTVRFA